MNTRQDTLQQWLRNTCHLPEHEIQALPHDASTRRYFRVHHEQQSFIAMDSPPATENNLAFVSIAKALRNLGLQTPEVMAVDLNQGFLLLTDFGDKVYLKELKNENAQDLYGYALNALHILRNCHDVPGWKLPFFTAEFMRNELELFKEWFLRKHLNLTLSFEDENKLNTVFDFLAHSAARQPTVFMHRDYHSGNLLLLPNDDVGIIDFQDAFIGPVTYDIVSLLRDCYIDWPVALVRKLVLQYRDTLSDITVSEDEFFSWFDLMGIQRHLKALLTFSRKYHRDHNPHYLDFIPRTMRYLLTVSQQYPDTRFLHFFLKDHLCAP